MMGVISFQCILGSLRRLFYTLILEGIREEKFCQAIQKEACDRCHSMSQKCHYYNNRQELKKKGDAVTEETGVTGVSQKCHRRINRKKK
jgi:hypothetical protein